MIVTKNIAPLRAKISKWRNQQQKTAFVPTMGNLHPGHLSLITLAKKHAQRVVVSIYVNPLQFSVDEDLATYPRTLEQDLEKLKKIGCDVVFTPSSHLIYPEGEMTSSYIEVPALSQILEGKVRPHFFKGVATVVLKLFQMVEPDIAIFGKKDYQQLLIIKKMVKDFYLPIKVLGAPIEREADGLAMSSRNAYLNELERKKSCLLSRTLTDFCRRIEQGENIKVAQQESIALLEKGGFEVDYLTLRQVKDLAKIQHETINLTAENATQKMLVLAAARLGTTRLLDNIECFATRET